eukprot:scaffold12240_cov170-Amphora_coffeaeformis.AAC.1
MAQKEDGYEEDEPHAATHNVLSSQKNCNYACRKRNATYLCRKTNTNQVSTRMRTATMAHLLRMSCLKKKCKVCDAEEWSSIVTIDTHLAVWHRCSHHTQQEHRHGILQLYVYIGRQRLATTISTDSSEEDSVNANSKSGASSIDDIISLKSSSSLVSTNFYLFIGTLLFAMALFHNREVYEYQANPVNVITIPSSLRSETFTLNKEVARIIMSTCMIFSSNPHGQRSEAT